MRRASRWAATRTHRVERTRARAVALATLPCCALLFLVLALLGIAPTAAAASLHSSQRAPGGNFADPAIRAVDIDEPAVVRIGTDERATLDLQLCTRTVTLPLGGGTYDVASTGSGAFISSSGDILTADHVVHPPDDEVVLFASGDIASVLDNLGQFDPSCGLQSAGVSPSDIANGLVQLKYTAHVSGLRSVVWLSTAYSGVIDATTLSDAPTLAATVEAFSSYSQDDLALVHVPFSDTPAIATGSSADVAVEDALTVIGFPGNGDVTDSANNMLTPSVNNVRVSAIKANDNGSPLIQVAGNVEHGDSGGPLLNAQGQVVGVVSFGGADPQGSTSFMRATASAQALIAGQHIDTAPGHFEQAWTQAFDDYASTYAGHWHVAEAKMRALAAAYPQFKALYPYLTYASTAAEQEQTQSGATLPTTMLLIAGGVVIAIVPIVALVLILAIRSRAKRRARAMPATQPGYLQQYPGGFPLPYGPYGAQPAPPYPGSPYGPGYGMPTRPSDGGGPQPVAAYGASYRPAAPPQALPTAFSPRGAPSSGWPERDWRQPSNPGNPGGGNTGVAAGAATSSPALPAWPWRASEPPPGTDAYNTSSGVGPGDPSGH
jgi:S1-C subfamily serine protease